MQIKRQMQPRWKKLSASLVGFSVDQTPTSARVTAEVLLGKGADGGRVFLIIQHGWYFNRKRRACLVPGLNQLGRSKGTTRSGSH